MATLKDSERQDVPEVCEYANRSEAAVEYEARRERHSSYSSPAAPKILPVYADPMSTAGTRPLNVADGLTQTRTRAMQSCLRSVVSRKADGSWRMRSG